MEHVTGDGYLYVGESLHATDSFRKLESLLCRRQGCIHRATDYPAARAILESSVISAVLIDHELESCSSIDFMRWIHQIARVPVLIVVDESSTSLAIESVIALEAGAVDVIDSRIDARELAARVHASIRKYFHAPTGGFPQDREAAGAPGLWHDADGRLPQYFATRNNSLYFSDSSRITLQGKEAGLLALLASHYPHCLSREEISHNLFQRDWTPADRSVDNLVSRLRRQIGPANHEIPVIETVRHGGYKLRHPIRLL